MFKYNYIFFNAEDNKLRKDPDGYYTICTEDLISMDNVELVSYPVDYACYPIRYLYLLHHSKRLNRYINFPLKKAWFPYYFKTKFKSEDKICFVILNEHLPVEYLYYLKNKFPNAKFVKIYRDLMSRFRKSNPDYTDGIMRDIFDIQMSFDEGEAKKYGYSYFSEFESKIDVPISSQYPLSDVFFAGHAKNRLPKLMAAYKRFSEVGLRCDYYITGVPEEQRVSYPGIVYADKPMPYREMLYRTVNSRCVLEINQEGAVGYTSRFLESVMYGKRLITDNISISNSKFYNSNYIQCINSIEELDAYFVLADVGKVDYHYNGEFSPVKLIEQIDRELTQTEVKKIK